MLITFFTGKNYFQTLSAPFLSLFSVSLSLFSVSVSLFSLYFSLYLSLFYLCSRPLQIFLAKIVSPGRWVALTFLAPFHLHNLGSQVGRNAGRYKGRSDFLLLQENNIGFVDGILLSIGGNEISLFVRLFMLTLALIKLFYSCLKFTKTLQ